MFSKLEENVPLHEKLDLAKNNFASKNSSINTKEIVINWIFHSVGKYQCESPSDNYLILWNTLYDLLKTESQHASKDGILLNTSCVKITIDALKKYPSNDSNSAVILTCLTKLLQTSTLNAVFVSDVDTLLSLLFSTFEVICKIHTSKTIDMFSLNEAKVFAGVVMDFLQAVSYPQHDGSKALVFAESLPTIAAFIHLNSESSKDELLNLQDRLAEEVVAIVLSIQSKLYGSLLTTGKENNTEPNKLLLEFFKNLQSLLMNEVILFYNIKASVAAASLMKKLLSVFLSQSKTNNLDALQVLALFSAISGMDIPLIITMDSCCNFIFQGDQTNIPNILAINKLLAACAPYPHLFGNVAVPSDFIKPTKWLEGLLAALMDFDSSINKPAWLQCFRLLLTVSPAIMKTCVCPLLNSTLLGISLDNNEDKEEYIQLFSTILSTYSQLRQIPKFFVKLLLCLADAMKSNSGGKLLIKGQVVSAVLELFAKCVSELPSGQTIELWKIFNRTYCTFRRLSKAYPSSTGGLFYVSQLFSTFLLHAKLFDNTVPENVLSQVEDLMQQTSKEIKVAFSVLKNLEHKAVQTSLFYSSILMLCYAIGETRLAFNIFNDTSQMDIPVLKDSNLALHFSVLHSFLGAEDLASFSIFFETEDILQSYFLVLLSVQKIRSLKRKGNLVDEENEHLQMFISFLLQHVKSHQNSTFNCVWDMDLCTLDAHNYGTAVWNSLLKLMPLIMNSLSHKQISLICSSAVDILMQEPQRVYLSTEVDTRSLVLRFLCSEFFQESYAFQTDFVTSLWKYSNKLLTGRKRSHDESDTNADSTSMEKVLEELGSYKNKWAKYAATTPKDSSDDNLNSLWLIVKNASNILNDVLESKELPKQMLKIPETELLLELLSYLPLEYLLPGNQIRCSIGLSVLFFLLPQSCKSSKANKLAEHISTLLIAIFEGVRSIWLFDFVKSGLYLRSVVNILESLKMKTFDKSFDWARRLLEHLINLCSRNAESLLSVEEYFFELSNNITGSTSSTLVVFTMLQRLVLLLERPYLQKNYKEVCERVAFMAGSSVVKCIKHKSEQKSTSEMYALLINCYTGLVGLLVSSKCQLDKKKQHKWLKVLPDVIEIVLLRVSNTEEEVEVYLKFLCKVCLHNKDISQYIPSDFVYITWRTMSSYLEEKCKKNHHQAMTSSSPDLNIKPESLAFKMSLDCTKHMCPNYIYPTTDGTLQAVNLITLNEFEINTLHSVSKTASDDELKQIFEEILIDSEKSGLDIAVIDVVSFQMRLLIIRHLIDVITEKKKLLNVFKPIQKLLTNLNYVMNQTCGFSKCLVFISVPVLEFVSFILKKDKGVLPKQCVLQCLHFCVSVGVEQLSNDPVIFIKAFNANWNVLNDLITHHHDLVLSSNAAYLSFVAILLKSVVQAGNKDILMTHSSEIQQQIQQCAQNIDRLLTLTSRNKVEFAKLVPYLIADYVDCVQHITVHSSVKDHIILGINRLLDICSEDSLQMLAVNINYSCREIYTNLVKNYKQYRYSGDASHISKR